MIKEEVDDWIIVLLHAVDEDEEEGYVEEETGEIERTKEEQTEEEKEETPI